MSSARLSSSRPVHLISTRGRTRSGATRSSRGKSRTWRSPFAPSLTIRRPNFRSDTAHRNSATASDRKSVLLESCNSALSKRTARSSAGARSAWNLALRRGVIAGAFDSFLSGLQRHCLPACFREISSLQLYSECILFIESNRIPSVSIKAVPSAPPERQGRPAPTATGQPVSRPGWPLAADSALRPASLVLSLPHTGGVAGTTRVS